MGGASEGRTQMGSFQYTNHQIPITAAPLTTDEMVNPVQSYLDLMANVPKERLWSTGGAGKWRFASQFLIRLMTWNVRNVSGGEGPVPY
ncbi:hypothetical protein ACN38_g7215 [Penicillium nordicum]|uniref:Uncharacterized protein n=1 Tax=Penicillium nordicum TaxID=229535 RepID=A0A0M8P5V3_9EURO|nr:hypothetical protein ACN38_g7215 [Penicillium nordicum]